jgi:predicted phosphodiesterase
VFGHTHRALIRQVGGVLVINPGAAGPARFNLKPSVALLHLPGRDARLVVL